MTILLDFCLFAIRVATCGIVQLMHPLIPLNWGISSFKYSPFVLPRHTSEEGEQTVGGHVGESTGKVENKKLKRKIKGKEKKSGESEQRSAEIKETRNRETREKEYGRLLDGYVEGSIFTWE